MAPALTCASDPEQGFSGPQHTDAEVEFNAELKTNTALSCTAPSRDLDTPQARSRAAKFLADRNAESLTDGDSACHVSNASDTTSGVVGVSAILSLPASSHTSFPSPPLSSSVCSSRTFPGPSACSSSLASPPVCTLSADAAVVHPLASLPVSSQTVHVPLENTVGYRNLEMFISALLQTCSFLASQQVKTALFVLFAALHRVVVHRLFTLKRWACRRWHVATACGSQSGMQKRKKSGILSIKETRTDLTSPATAEHTLCASALRASRDSSPRASQKSRADTVFMTEDCMRVYSGINGHSRCSMSTYRVAPSLALFNENTPHDSTSAGPHGGCAAAVAAPPLPTGKEHATTGKERRDKQTRVEEKKRVTKERNNNAASSSQLVAAPEQQRLAGRAARKEDLAKKGEALHKTVASLLPVATPDAFCDVSPTSSSSASSPCFLSSSDLSCSISKKSVLCAHSRSGKQREVAIKCETASVSKFAGSEARVSPFSRVSAAQPNAYPANNSSGPAALAGERERAAKRTDKKKSTRQKIVPGSARKIAEQQQKQLKEHVKEEPQEEKRHQGQRQNLQHLQEPEQPQQKHNRQTSVCFRKAGSSSGEHVSPLQADETPSEDCMFTQATCGLTLRTAETFSPCLAGTKAATEIKIRLDHEDCQLRRRNGAAASDELQGHDAFSSAGNSHLSAEGSRLVPPSYSLLRMENKQGSVAHRRSRISPKDRPATLNTVIEFVNSAISDLRKEVHDVGQHVEADGREAEAEELVAAAVFPMFLSRHPLLKRIVGLSGRKVHMVSLLFGQSHHVRPLATEREPEYYLRVTRPKAVAYRWL